MLALTIHEVLKRERSATPEGDCGLQTSGKWHPHSMNRWSQRVLGRP